MIDDLDLHLSGVLLYAKTNERRYRLFSEKKRSTISLGGQLRAILGHREVVVALRPVPRFR